MAIDGTEVRVAGGGHIYVAPEGTAIPADLSPLPVAWVDLGYVTENGVSFSFGREVTDINAWQGDKVRVITTKEPASCKFELMQTNATVMQVAFGGGTITEAAGIYTFTPPKTGVNTTRALIIEFADGDDKYRYCIPRSQLQGNVDYSLTRNGAVTYPLEMGILDNGDNAKYSIISNDPAMKPGTAKAVDVK
jgi:hypothetical protein